MMRRIPQQRLRHDAAARLADQQKMQFARDRGRHLGLLCRETDFACLQRWAADHWGALRAPPPSLGFTRKKPPHATTISRALARFSLEQFRAGFARWLATLPQATAVTVAVDGKTSKRGHDAHGEPVHMLNVFAHELGLCLARQSTHSL